MNSKRRFYGEHLTPAQICEEYILPHIVDLLWDRLWVDLFCGEGSLIYPLVRVVEPSRRDEFFAEHVLMFDIQPDQVEKTISKAVEIGIPRDVAEKRVMTRDTLADYPAEMFGRLPTVHITNPPYLYLGYIAKRAKEHLKYFKGNNDGYQDLYQIALANDMRAGLEEFIYIIPTNFLYGDAVANRIREDLLFFYWIEKAFLFETRIFCHTGTNVGIFFFRKKRNPSKEIQEFTALKIGPHGNQERLYRLNPRFKYRAGARFDEFVERNRNPRAPKVKFYLMMDEVIKHPGPYKIRLVDANTFEAGEYRILEFPVDEWLFHRVKANVLFVRTVDTGGQERVGLYEIKKAFSADGIVVTRFTFRTHPIQLFFEPEISEREQLELAEYFNSVLEDLRAETDSEFMTTFKYSNASYTRKYLGLKQVKALISTYRPKGGKHAPEKKPPLLADLFKES
ncbi:MAG: N-6 DNA methylase [candidate division WOR-3 bacterium]